MTKEQQYLTLYSVLIDPELETIIKLAGITINSTNTTISCFNEYMRKKMINFAAEKNQLRGRINDDKRSFIESNLVSCIDSPTKKLFSSSKLHTRHSNYQLQICTISLV